MTNEVQRFGLPICQTYVQEITDQYPEGGAQVTKGLLPSKPFHHSESLFCKMLPHPCS